MKQIFTLFAVALISITHSVGQTNSLTENFNGKSITSLNSGGWLFSSGISIGSTPSKAEGLQFASPTSTNGTSNGTISTPDITLLENYVTISFNYGVVSGLNGTRTIEFGWMNASNQFTSLGTATLTSSNGSANTFYLMSLNTTITPNSTVKLHFILTAQNDKNAHVIIDDVKVTSNALAPLPIKLLSFSGSTNNNKAQLSWSVADNETGERFEIEKSSDSRSFTSVGNVFTTEKVGTENYNYNDAAELTGTTSYRLKIFNKDNTTAYSRIILLKKEGGKSQGITLLQNPIGSSLAFTYDAAENAIATVNIYNTAGMKIHSFQSRMQKGANTIVQAIDGKLVGGNYIMEVATPSERRTIKLTK